MRALPLISRQFTKALPVSWGDTPTGGALVGTAHCFAWVLDRLQMALDSVEAGHSTLVDLCAEVTQAPNRREIADRWSSEVYATTRDWPSSSDGGTFY